MRAFTVDSRWRDRDTVEKKRWSNETDMKPVRVMDAFADDASPLAAFLIRNAPQSIDGRHIAFEIRNRVVCYNGRTEAEQMMIDFPSGKRYGVPVENFIKMYGLESVKTIVHDWLFPVANQGETPSRYFERAAAGMLAAGVVRVETNGMVFEV